MTGDDVAVAGRERRIDDLTRDNYSYRESIAASGRRMSARTAPRSRPAQGPSNPP